MEIYELKYFLAVTRTENVNRAAEQIGISAGSISKAIGRLEAELQTNLLVREGRGIKISPQGEEFALKAAQIIELESDTRLHFLGHEIGDFNIHIASEEHLQAYLASDICLKIQSIFPKARIHFSVQTEQKALEMVKNYDAHFAFVSSPCPEIFKSKILMNIEFQTCASNKHPLVKLQKKSSGVSTKKLLNYPFVTPNSKVLGNVQNTVSEDGWRDDKFPRNIKYRVSSLKLIEKIVADGLALAYLPDYIINSANLTPITITDCKYTCKQKVKIVTNNPDRLGWLKTAWGLF